MHYTSRLYEDAEEVKQEHWTARTDHTVKEEGERYIMSSSRLNYSQNTDKPYQTKCYFPRIFLELIEMPADMSHSTTSYKQGL